MNLLPKIHVAKRQLGLDQDEAGWRALLWRSAGVASLKGADGRAQLAVMAELRRAGFRDAAAPRTKRAPHVRLVYALWGELQGLGAVAGGKAGGPALRAFVKRQTGAAAPEFLTPQASASVTEALKSWIAREKAKGAVS